MRSKSRIRNARYLILGLLVTKNKIAYLNTVLEIREVCNVNLYRGIRLNELNEVIWEKNKQTEIVEMS